MRDRISFMFADKIQETSQRKDSLIDESIELGSPTKISPSKRSPSKTTPKTEK